MACLHSTPPPQQKQQQAPTRLPHSLQQSCASPHPRQNLSRQRRGEESDAVDERSGGADELLPAISITAAAVAASSFEPQSDLERLRRRESRDDALGSHNMLGILSHFLSAKAALVRSPPPFVRDFKMLASTAVDYHGITSK